MTIRTPRNQQTTLPLYITGGHGLHWLSLAGLSQLWISLDPSSPHHKTTISLIIQLVLAHLHLTPSYNSANGPQTSG